MDKENVLFCELHKIFTDSHNMRIFCYFMPMLCSCFTVHS